MDKIIKTKVESLLKDNKIEFRKEKRELDASKKHGFLISFQLSEDGNEYVRITVFGRKAFIRDYFASARATDAILEGVSEIIELSRKEAL